MIKWVLYVILLLSALSLFVADCSEKNTLNPANSIFNESKYPFYNIPQKFFEIPQNSNLPENVSFYKPRASTAANIDVVAYDQKSLKNKSMDTSSFSIIQPISPPFEYNSSNTSYSGNSSYYVGADGHIITLANNESAVDPNYEQLIEFIREDKTNEIPYNNSSFVCSDAAERVHNNAEAYGFRSAWVYINFENESAILNQDTNALVVGHACNLFNTTDKGLVAIDSTGSSRTTGTASVNLSEWDNEVSLVKNEEYVPKLLYPFYGSDKLKAFSSMGKITNYYVFW